MAANQRNLPTKTMSSNDVKQRWGQVSAAIGNGETVVVESHGKPKMAVIPIDAYREYLDLRERERTEEILRQFDELTAQLADRNNDLTDEEAMELAVRAGKDINRRAAARLKTESGS